MNRTTLHTSVLIFCSDPKRSRTIHAALQQFVTPDLVLQTAPDYESALARGRGDDIDVLLLCDDAESERVVDMVFALRAAHVVKPVLILMSPSEGRRCYPLLDGMGAVECVHFSVVRAGQLAACARDLSRRQRQAEDFAELSQRCSDLEAENLHLHRQLAQLARELEALRRQLLSMR